MYSFDKKDYEIDGYKIFKPNEIIDAKTIDEISNYFDQKFLKYEDNHTYKNFGINYNDESFEHDKVVYNGFSKNQIYYRGNIKFNSDAVQENILYGKRASLSLRNVDDKIIRVIEDERILDLARYIMKTNDIMMLVGGFTQTYPGSLGEGKEFIQICQLSIIIEV